MRESELRRKIKKKLESKGWLCFTLVAPTRTIIKNGQQIWIPSRGQLFDMVAIKDQTGIPIELKSKTGQYKPAQKRRQTWAADAANTIFALIKESKKKGKIRLEFPNKEPCISDMRLSARLEDDLKEMLE